MAVDGISQYEPVGLIRTYSNQQDRADLLRRARLWVMEDQQGSNQDPQVTVGVKPNSAVPRRVVDRLGEDVVREMIEARRAGVKLVELAERYGISESSVKRVLTSSLAR
jgi:hypothetical protein